jgi:hypothetical protein
VLLSRVFVLIIKQKEFTFDNQCEIMELLLRKWPRGETAKYPPEPGQQIGAVDVNNSTAPHAHPSTTENQDQDHPHHACNDDQDHPHHACNDGWVTIGQIALDPETGEEVEEFALYLCRKCAERS